SSVAATTNASRQYQDRSMGTLEAEGARQLRLGLLLLLLLLGLVLRLVLASDRALEDADLDALRDLEEREGLGEIGDRAEQAALGEDFVAALERSEHLGVLLSFLPGWCEDQ